MRSRLAWVAGGLGLAGAVAYRALTRRRRPAGGERAPDPAEELRRRIAESRAIVEEREERKSAETPVDRAEPAGGLEERWRAIHERGRAVAEEMRGAPTEE